MGDGNIRPALQAVVAANLNIHRSVGRRSDLLFFGMVYPEFRCCCTPGFIAPHLRCFESIALSEESYAHFDPTVA